MWVICGLREILPSYTSRLKFYTHLITQVEKYPWNVFCIIARSYLKLTFIRRNKGISFYYRGFDFSQLGKSAWKCTGLGSKICTVVQWQGGRESFYSPAHYEKCRCEIARCYLKSFVVSVAVSIFKCTACTSACLVNVVCGSCSWLTYVYIFIRLN